jgi:hypothetical protein
VSIGAKSVSQIQQCRGDRQKRIAACMRNCDDELVKLFLWIEFVWLLLFVIFSIHNFDDLLRKCWHEAKEKLWSGTTIHLKTISVYHRRLASRSRFMEMPLDSNEMEFHCCNYKIAVRREKENFNWFVNKDVPRCCITKVEFFARRATIIVRHQLNHRCDEAIAFMGNC